MNTWQNGEQNTDFNLIIKGSLKSLSAVNVIGAVIGFGLLYFWMVMVKSVGVTAFFIGYSILVVYLLADTVYWIKRGIHEIRIAGDYFEIVRGRQNTVTRIHAQQITDIQYSSQLSRRSLQILLGNKIIKIEGLITLYPGPKVWITSDAFDTKEFDAASELIQKMFAGSQQR